MQAYGPGKRHAPITESWPGSPKAAGAPAATAEEGRDGRTDGESDRRLHGTGGDHGGVCVLMLLLLLPLDAGAGTVADATGDCLLGLWQCKLVHVGLSPRGRARGEAWRGGYGLRGVQR